MLVFKVCPENSSRAERKEFQTEMLTNMMEHLLAADALLGDQGALGNHGNYTNMASNVFYLAGRVVDKLWQGILFTVFS